jgi:intracellular sulfur oxidation DsrE/DsrF family protein
MKTVFVVNHDQMGHGDIELGSRILATCLRKLLKFADLEAVVLYNAGVKLATENSPVASELRQLHEAGVEILPCGTCVTHYDLHARMIVDRVSDMDEILATLRDADKVITL